jgi:hypothetical protein
MHGATMKINKIMLIIVVNQQGWSAVVSCAYSFLFISLALMSLKDLGNTLDFKLSPCSECCMLSSG